MNIHKQLKKLVLLLWVYSVCIAVGGTREPSGYVALSTKVGYWASGSVLQINSSPTDWGSGFLLNEQGWIVTAKHVVENSDLQTIKVQQNNINKLIAVEQVLIPDKQLDLAFIKVNPSDLQKSQVRGTSTLVPLPLLNEKIDVQTEDFCIAGYPKVSDTQNDLYEARILQTIDKHQGYYHLSNTSTEQTLSAAVRSGNSGGPVIIEEGYVAGIVVKVQAGEGMRTPKQTYVLDAYTIAHVADSLRIKYNNEKVWTQYINNEVNGFATIEQPKPKLPDGKWNKSDTLSLLADAKRDERDDESLDKQLEKLKQQQIQRKRNKEEAKTKLTKAIEYIQKEEYTEADSLLTEAILLAPTMEILYRKRAIVRIHTRQFNDALVDINRSIAIDSMIYEAYEIRGEINEYLYRYVNAIQDYDKVLELSSILLHDYQYRGGDVTQFKANESIEELGFDIDDPIVNLLSNESHVGFGKAHLDSMRMRRRYRELKEKMAVPYYKRGRMKEFIGDVVGAIEDFCKAITNSPYQSYAYCGRGRLEMLTGDTTKALTDLNAALRIDPELSDAYAARSIIKLNSRDTIGALEDINESINIEPNEPVCYFNRSIIKTLRKDTIGAIVDLSLAMNLDHKFYQAYYNRGVIKYHSKDFVGAEKDFTKTIEIAPMLYQAYYNRGQAYIELHEKLKSKADFIKTYQISVDTTVLSACAMILYKLYDKSHACQAWKKAAELGDTTAIINVNRFCKILQPKKK